MSLHPFRLEQEIAEAANALRAGCVTRRLTGWSQEDEGPLAPFRRWTSRERFQQLLELPDALPNRESLRRWTAALILERVTWADRVSVEIARREVEHEVQGLGDRRWSVRRLVLELVATQDERRRAQVAEGLTRVSSHASEETIWWLRRRQAAALDLGLESLSWLEAPWRKLSTRDAAEAVLTATDDLASEMLGRSSSWHDSLWLGAAMDAVEGWPAHLTPRWFRTLFGPWKTLRGLRVEPTPLWPPTCGASFSRALVHFGTAVHRAWAARLGAPFSLVQRPFDASQAAYGALFGSLLVSVPFLRRRLGLGKPAALAQSRSMAASLLVAVRLEAARAVLSSQVDVTDAVETHARWVARALNANVPDETAGVLPRYDPRASARLAGLLQAARMRRELVETFDEDWFDNPRAHEQLAAIDVTNRCVVDESIVRQGAEAIREELAP